MVNVSTFAAELEAEIERNVDGPVLWMVKEILHITYHEIMVNWPKYTFWSAANHHVSLNEPVTTPEPSQRPTHRNALYDEAAIKFNEALEFIDNLKPAKNSDIVVYISNPVPYAADVSFTTSLGIDIYQNAEDTAELLSSLSRELPIP